MERIYTQQQVDDANATMPNGWSVAEVNGAWMVMHDGAVVAEVESPREALRYADDARAAEIERDIAEAQKPKVEAPQVDPDARLMAAVTHLLPQGLELILLEPDEDEGEHTYAVVVIDGDMVGRDVDPLAAVRDGLENHRLGYSI